MKKIALAALAVAAISSAAFAAGKKKSDVSFSNEVSSDIIHVFNPKGNDDSHTRFAGINDNVVASYDGSVVKVGVDATASFYDTNENDDDAPYKIEWTSADWYIEFNPFSVIGFGFSDELYTSGAHLPVWDGDVNAGNYSTTGFAVLIRPIDNLTFGAGFDFPAELLGGDGSPKAYELAFGVDFTSDVVDIGGSLRHVGSDNRFQIGAYASIKAIDKLVLNVGFTHSEDGDAGLGDVDFVNGVYTFDTNGDGTADARFTDWFSGIYGENIATVGLSFEAKSFDFTADLAFNFDSDYKKYTKWWYNGHYDFYTAVGFVFGITDSLNLDIKGLFLADFGDDTVWNPAKSSWRSLGSSAGVLPKIVFTAGKHTLSAGMMLQTCFDDDYGYTTFALPVSWKYVY